MTIKRCAFGLVVVGARGPDRCPRRSKEHGRRERLGGQPLVTIDGAIPEWNDATPATDKGVGRQVRAEERRPEPVHRHGPAATTVARSTIALHRHEDLVSTPAAKKSKDAGILFMQKHADARTSSSPPSRRRARS
ncbi:MAG: hypothetical protein M0C28_40555 [Candidatus Moduliflexus flocculans]|nr:hypothetical protein [Candidatus Moduliflexus flocculans]